MAKGTLIAAMKIGRAAEDEFHDWYDTEHLPERQRVSGFLLCERWLGAQDRTVSVATYDLEKVAVLKTPGYLAIGGDNLSPWSKRVTARVERLMRFEGDQILPGDALPPANAGGLLLNAMNIAPELEAEFNEWYDKEHIPALAAVPGVLCARRFRGTGNRKYVALYHLETPDVVESDEWKKARQSDWTSRLQPQFRDHLRLVLRRYARGGERVDRLRLAIVGCGNISQLNAPGYLQHPRCEVVAVCDTRVDFAQRRAREWGIAPRIYSELAQVLDDRAIDAVELLTPTWLHADQVVAALEAGKHVSCQKPLATNIAEAERIAAAVTRARTTFRVTENFLYYPPIVKAKELLDAGAIGEPSLVRIHTTRPGTIVGLSVERDPEAVVWRRDPGRNPGGVLYDDGVHKYATAAYWIGEIGDVSAIVTRGRDFIMETPSVVTWRFKGRDCLGIVDYTAAPEMTMRGRYVLVDEFFEIHGSRGIIWVTRCSGEMLDLPPVMVIRGTETTSYQVPSDWRLGFDGAAADFIDGVLDGRQPAQDIHEATRMLRVPLAIYEAAQTGRAVAPESVK